MRGKVRRGAELPRHDTCLDRNRAALFITPQSLQSKLTTDSSSLVLLHVGISDAQMSSYHECHIPFARYFSTASVEVRPHWDLLSHSELIQAALASGIRPNQTVVVYGETLAAVSRVADALESIQLPVLVLEGGLIAWRKADFPVTESSDNHFFSPTPPSIPWPPPTPRTHTISLNQYFELRRNNPSHKVVAVQTIEEYNGINIRYSYMKHLRPGRIPGAKLLIAGTKDQHDISCLVDSVGNIQWRKMETGLENLEIDRKDSVTFYCGTGWRASLAARIARGLGWLHATVYSPGWMEFAALYPQHIET